MWKENSMTIKQIQKLGYSPAKIFTSGENAGILKMIYTVGLFVGINEWCWRTRFCYPDWISATKALEEWDGIGDPPGPWIKEKGGVERSNPNSGKAAR